LPTIEQGGNRLNHFAIWHDKVGNGPAVTTQGGGGMSLPDMEDFEGEQNGQNNLIIPEQCAFIQHDLSFCSIIRPASDQNAGAVHVLHAFSSSAVFWCNPRHF
jgi:hypothetical protein